MQTAGGEGGDPGVEKYVFNEAIARRRLHGAIVATILILAVTFLIQWVRT